MNEVARPSVLVVGVHQSTEAYPNTLYRLQGLRERFDVREVNRPLWSTPEGGTASVRSPWRTIYRAVVSHVQLAWEVFRGPAADIAYIPYPAPSVALVLSMLPCKRRPRRFVLDGFISLYDTIVNDRKLWRPEGWRARLLWVIERTAFRKADAVLVDTPQNANFYAGTFRLPRDKFVVLPLSTNEAEYAPSPYRPVEGRCRVLFIGTLVPLHGIETIVAAARLLSHQSEIEFRVIGNGTEAPKLHASLAGLSNVVWERRWHTPSELADNIAEADICLGIFGGTSKAQRVCPYKLYAYASVGRATVTGDTDWLRSINFGEAAVPFRAVVVSDPRALASAITDLANSPAERMRLARNAEAFYRSQLANQVALQLLDNELMKTFAQQAGA